VWYHFIQPVTDGSTTISVERYDRQMDRTRYCSLTPKRKDCLKCIIPQLPSITWSSQLHYYNDRLGKNTDITSCCMLGECSIHNTQHALPWDITVPPVTVKVLTTAQYDRNQKRQSVCLVSETNHVHWTYWSRCNSKSICLWSRRLTVAVRVYILFW
jgi:hypothetical protein